VRGCVSLRRMNAYVVLLVAPMVLLTLISKAEAGPSDLAEPFSLVAPEDQAIVVLARPRFLLKTTKLRILDHEHRCVAALKGKTHTAIRMAPGKHSVIAFMRKDARQIDLEVEGGRTYVVRTRPHGTWGLEVQILPAKRNTPAFEAASEWLADSKRFTADLQKCSRSVQKKRTTKKLGLALEKERSRLDEDPVYQRTHSLTPQDGRTPEESAALGTP